jgi:3-oxoacyl-[acyl-carrier-protein] synthase-3
MINETIRKKVGYLEEKTISTLDKYGNTSSVSIPLSLSSAKDRLGGGAKVVLSGFGVGLSWASCCITLPRGVILNLFEDNCVYSS